MATAATAVERGALGIVVRCPCNNVLGERFASYFVVRHKGRRLVCQNLLAVGCEDCGRELTIAVRPAATPLPEPAAA